MSEIILNILNSKSIECSLGFYNNHEIKIKNRFVKEIYPIPVISCKIHKVEIDIGFDVVSDHYLGFLELTLSKRDILNFDFSKFNNLDFEIYGFNNYLEDFYFGNVENAKQTISKSEENKFHIGINISNINQMKNILKVLGV